MHIILAVLGVLLLAFIFIKIFLPIIQKKKIIKDLESFSKNNQLNYQPSSNKDVYDLAITNKEITFLVKIVIIPSFSEIQINNVSTWEVKYGAGEKVGKVQPHKRYLTEIIPLMKYDAKQAEQKVFVFSPNPKKIVKYVNENEIDFVTSTSNVYGARIIGEKNYQIFK